MQVTDTRAPWWSGQTAVLLSNAPDHLPARANGEKYSVPTIYRWTTAGANGVRLRRFRVGPRGWATTVEELQRFAVAMTTIGGGDL